MISERRARQIAHEVAGDLRELHNDSYHSSNSLTNIRLSALEQRVWNVDVRLSKVEGVRRFDPCQTATVLRPEDV